MKFFFFNLALGCLDQGIWMKNINQSSNLTLFVFGQKVRDHSCCKMDISLSKKSIYAD